MRHTVLDRDRFVEFAIGQQVKQWPERFVLHDFKIRLGRCKARFHVTTTGNSEPIAPVEHFAALVFQPLNGIQNHIDGMLVDERAHDGFGIKRISNRQAPITS